MAFLKRDLTATLKVIVSVESTIGIKDPKKRKEAYAEYLKSFRYGKQGDEAILQLTGEPTRFVCKSALDWLQKTKLRTKTVKIEGRKPSIDPNITGDTVRRHLIGIENPPGVEKDKELVFSLDKDGFAHFEVMSQLDDAGVLPEIGMAITNFSTRQEREEEAEKNA